MPGETVVEVFEKILKEKKKIPDIIILDGELKGSKKDYNTGTKIIQSIKTLTKMYSSGAKLPTIIAYSNSTRENKNMLKEGALEAITKLGNKSLDNLIDSVSKQLKRRKNEL